MILIKDRHRKNAVVHNASPKRGKYDTYKGSTQGCTPFRKAARRHGKYDTYKGSTPSPMKKTSFNCDFWEI